MISQNILHVNLLVKIQASCRLSYKSSENEHRIFTPGHDEESDLGSNGNYEKVKSCNWLITSPVGQIIRIKHAKVTIGTDADDELQFYDGHNAKSPKTKTIKEKEYESTYPGIESTGSVMYIRLWKANSNDHHDIAIHLEFEAIGMWLLIYFYNIYLFCI